MTPAAVGASPDVCLLTMPELPEVETVVRGLRRQLIGAELGRVVYASKRVSRANLRGWRSILPGRRILHVKRRGKYILIRLSEGHALVVHLRMTGRLWIRATPYRRDPHDRLIIDLGSEKCLILNDARQFARAEWRAPGMLESHPGLAKLGPDALEMSAAEFRRTLRQSRRPIKSFLLDQTRMAGLGNIYADESLFGARIRPTTPSRSIGPKRVARLHREIQVVLRRAIDACGTTVDTFSDPEGAGGGFAPLLKVYRRTGEPCQICGHPIERIRISGRGTHFCRHCQKR